MRVSEAQQQEVLAAVLGAPADGVHHSSHFDEDIDNTETQHVNSAHP